MSSSSEERWQLRFENYGRALTRLRNACEMEDYSELEVAGLVHTFGFTFNLAWNVLKGSAVLRRHRYWDAKTSYRERIHCRTDL